MPKPQPALTKNLFGLAGRIVVQEGWPEPTVRVGRCAVTVQPVSGFIERVPEPEWERPTLTLGPIGSERGTLEVFFPHDDESEIRVRRGCFSGTLAEFAAAAEAHEDPDHRRRYGQVARAIELLADALAE